MGRKVFNIISTVFLVLLVLVVILLFVIRASGNSPSIFGYQVYRVSSGSMEPTLMKGDVIVDKKVPAEEIKKNDIVTYKALSGDMAGEMITHRVVTEPEINNGTYTFQTKGDWDGAALDDKITYEQIQGKFQYKIPVIDKLYSFFFTPYGLISFIFIIVALFGYEMISLLMAYRSLDEKDDDYYEPKQKKKRKKRK